MRPGTVLALVPSVPTRHPTRPTVLVAGDDADWPVGFARDLVAAGFGVEPLGALDLAPERLAREPPRALLLLARPLGLVDALTLRRCREVSPETALVVVGVGPTHPDLKRAFESGATSFLSWPSPPDALRRAIDSRAGTGPRPRRGRRPGEEGP